MVTRYLEVMDSASELTMYATELSDLAPEILILIFQSCPSFSTAFCLSQTSQRLYEIWRRNVSAIVTEVLPRMIDCTPEANQLIDAQPERFVFERADDKNKTSIDRVQIILANEKKVQRAVKLFESGTTPIHHYPRRAQAEYEHSNSPRRFTEQECYEFTQAFYRVLILGALSCRETLPPLSEFCTIGTSHLEKPSHSSARSILLSICPSSLLVHLTFPIRTSTTGSIARLSWLLLCEKGCRRTVHSRNWRLLCMLKSYPCYHAYICYKHSLQYFRTPISSA